MEVEVGGLTGAGYGEKSPDRLAQRNGCRKRDWDTRAGTVELRIPSGRRVVCAFIATAFAQETAEAAKVQWRKVADQLRPTVPKLAALMASAEKDVFGATPLAMLPAMTA